ncbi:MAG: aminomethyl transferase family protein [Planctomycetes bacterium]|nr:aminomethyl transferase family protein [Planctomycetota bacterium]
MVGGPFRPGKPAETIVACMMLYDTPLRKRHDAWIDRERTRTPPAGAVRPGAATGHRGGDDGVEYIGYGPPDDDGSATCEIPATFGTIEAEYAALRRGAGVLDGPHRGTLRVRGAERIEFLDRMLTQTLKNLSAGDVAEAFWLNRKGRIDADLLLVETGAELFVDLDVHLAAATTEALGGFLFSEDVEVLNVTDAMHRLSVHGPGAGDLLDAAADGDGFADGAATLGPLRAGTGTIGMVEVVAARRDLTGGPGFELFLPRGEAENVWDGLLEAAAALGPGARVRPVGWFAFNTARIEAGVPLLNVDFGRENLPHETGLLSERVSFTKGCFLGQEIVARIESQGTPRQVLVGLRLRGEALPVAGGQVFAADAPVLDEPVGVVTSSTLSPMLGAQPIAFAMMHRAHAAPGTTVRVNAEGEQIEATVGALRSWPGE